MKKSLLALVVLCSTLSLSMNAQIYDWATFYTGEAQERFICHSNDGSVYAIGGFQGTFSHGDFSITADLGGYDVYLTKMNSEGTVQWLQRLGGTNYDGGRKIVADSEGNIYALIDTQGLPLILPSGLTLTHNIPTSAVYVVKFDSNGTYIWHTAFAGLSDIAVADNSVYCSLFSTGIVKISQASGAQLASFNTPGMNTLKITATADGRVAATTFIYGSVTLPDGSTLYNSGMGIAVNIFGDNASDYGIICLDTALTFQWSQQLCASLSPAQLTADDAGNIYTTLSISYEATIDDSLITVPVGQNSRKLIVSLSNEGTVNWITHYDNGTDGIKSAIGTADGVIVGADNFQGITISDGSTFYNGSQDGMILALNSDGSVDFADFIGRTINSTNIFSFSKDAVGNYYAGAFTNNTNFYIGCNYYENQTSYTFVVLKFHEGDRSAPTPTIVNDGGVLTATPAFTGTINWYQQGNSTPIGTGSTYIPTQIGFYSVSYTNEYGCSATSGDVVIQQLDSEEPVLSCSTNADLMAGELCTGLAEIVVTATDNSGVASIINSFNDQGATVVAEFPVGSTTITFTATDGFGNASTCDVAVNVMDVDGPSITCPASVDAETLTNEIALTVGEAVAVDNCGSVAISNSFSANADASGTYPVGTTTVIYTASDDAGNSASCEVTVNVTAISSVSELSASHLEVWPNPASDHVTVNMNQPWFGRIVLRASDGKLMREWNQAQSENLRVDLPLDGIASGIYFIEVQGNQNLRSKIIIE
ncbi:MAG: HYR domain-containing protein [Flavobacteriales bacterium]|jgi:hypothetical protein